MGEKVTATARKNQSENDRLKEQMTQCLRDAKAAWTEAFLIEGYDQKFDKWEVTPDPMAIAEIAKELFRALTE